MTPCLCEINYLKILKNIQGYGLHKTSVTVKKYINKIKKNSLGLQHELGIGSRGLVICRNNIELESYLW